MNCISTVITPAPLHSSHLPPSVLNEKYCDVNPNCCANGCWANSSLMASYALRYVAGLERVLLPIGFWSTNSMRLIASTSPANLSKSPGASHASPMCLFSAGYNIPLISEDLPEPLTPVTTVITFRGIVTLTPRRLFILAPRIFMHIFHLRLPLGSGMDSFPVMYFIVWLDWCFVELSFHTFAALPKYTICPPWVPASGPTSMR